METKNFELELFIRKNWIILLLSLMLLISLGYNYKLSNQKSNLQENVDDLESDNDDLKDKVDELEN
jgi:hypothetical protein